MMDERWTMKNGGTNNNTVIGNHKQNIDQELDRDIQTHFGCASDVSCY